MLKIIIFFKILKIPNQYIPTILAFNGKFDSLNIYFYCIDVIFLYSCILLGSLPTYYNIKVDRVLPKCTYYWYIVV